MDQQNVAQFLVSCLRAEGVKYVFGIPGEENIKFVRAVEASGDIRFILARHEQGAVLYGRYLWPPERQGGRVHRHAWAGGHQPAAGRGRRPDQLQPAGGHLGPGGAKRIYKESHQIIDLVGMFKPVTKWADTGC